MFSFTKDDFVIKTNEKVFNGYFAVHKKTVKHRLFNGSWSVEYEREVFERGDAAAVLLYDPFLEKVVMLEQFRIGAVSSNKSPWMLEVVAGIIENCEDPEEVVKREAQEEAGQVIDELVEIGSFFTTPGGSSEKLTLFCAKVSAENAEGIFGLESENEDIRTFTLTIDEVIAGLDEGIFENATSIIALQWLVLKREKLHKIWKNQS